MRKQRQLLWVGRVALSAMFAMPVMASTTLGQDRAQPDADASDRRPRPFEGRGGPPELRDRREMGRPDDLGGERGDRGDRGMDRDGRFERLRYRAVPTPEEWERTVEFMNEHAPNMARKLEDSSRLSTPAQERVKAIAFERYRDLQQLEGNPELYEIRVKLLTVRDALFGYLGDIREADENAVSEVREKAREQVAELIDLTLKERELRLKDLEKRLDKERQSLQRDRGRMDELIDERLEHELNPGRRDSAGPMGPPDAGAEMSLEEQEMRQRRIRELRQLQQGDATQPATQPTAQ